MADPICRTALSHRTINKRRCWLSFRASDQKHQPPGLFSEGPRRCTLDRRARPSEAACHPTISDPGFPATQGPPAQPSRRPGWSQLGLGWAPGNSLSRAMRIDGQGMGRAVGPAI
eukprot:5795588-Pyramimonas_sp.AAC.1